MLSFQLCPTLCDPMDCSHWAPLSMGFSRQGYWSGLPHPPPGDLPHPGIEPMASAAPALQVDSLLLSHWGSPRKESNYLFNPQGWLPTRTLLTSVPISLPALGHRATPKPAVARRIPGFHQSGFEAGSVQPHQNSIATHDLTLYFVLAASTNVEGGLMGRNPTVSATS